MKKWHLFRTIFLAIAAVLLLTGSKGASKSSCETAKMLLNNKLHEDAQFAYADLLKKEPNLDCAKNGIRATVNSREKVTLALERGRAYKDAGQLEQVRNEYIEALKLGPTSTEARQTLNQLLRTSEDKTTANKFL